MFFRGVFLPRRGKRESMSIFEIGMLVCFGFSWPVNIRNAWKARTTANQSLLFLIVVDLGYACGITHKILYNPDLALAFYILNFSMVFVNICIYLRNMVLDRKREKEAKA